ncbi:hypothetical protein FB45DRAFT_896471 [Roridomyces roridus]|uniref:Uncharacterized protein n=1 Tax=Roridomyces roridus TaxID=1738132 RepID=A0AAD7CAI9_9AGAR|nr:hypothetical protein FB45DRAFT_896471 [Roridomyces roridus]
MSPRFLWFFLGTGFGVWWATRKKDFQGHVDYRRTAPVTAAPNNSEYHYRDWDQERARVREFTQNAGDVVAELSEATLDTILQATETLKAKMAEHRALRDEERRIEEERMRSPIA